LRVQTAHEIAEAPCRQSPRPTKLYDHASDQITIDAFQRIAI